MVNALMVITVRNFMSVGLAQKQVKSASNICHPRMISQPTGAKNGHVGSTGFHSHLSGTGSNWGFNWSTNDFINAHKAVKDSRKFNFEGCMIPIPTSIRYDRVREALGILYLLRSKGC